MIDLENRALQIKERIKSLDPGSGDIENELGKTSELIKDLKTLVNELSDILSDPNIEKIKEDVDNYLTERIRFIDYKYYNGDN